MLRRGLPGRRSSRRPFLAGVGGALVALVLSPVLGQPAARAVTGSPGSVVFQALGPGGLSVAGLGAYRGDLVVGPTGGGLGVVDRVPFEDYVAGISEVPANWPMAALEAQAVAARTYALWQVLVGADAPWTALGGQICASDACQVYRGLSREEAPYGDRWVAAVRATARQVLLYDGRVIEAVYGSSDGGQTVYGGVPWLPSTNDPDDALSPEHHWSWTAPLAALAPLMGVPGGYQLASLVSRPDAILATLSGPDGSSVTRSMAPSDFHALLNSRLGPPPGLPLPLPSWRYRVSTVGTRVAVDGAGAGNGMGLSQYGALGKALRGLGAGQILRAYYGGVGPSVLGAGQEPATISVALADPAPTVTIRAAGPVRVLDSGGRVLAEGAAGPWVVRPSGAGVTVSGPASGSPAASPPPPEPPTPAPAAALSAVPMHATAPVSAAVSLPVRNHRGPLAVAALVAELGALALLIGLAPRRVRARPRRALAA